MHLCTAIVYNQTSNNTFAGSLQAKSIHVHDFTDSPHDILVNNWGTSLTMYYVHKDYLGSISAITDATGNLVESLSYDPWGRRRKATDWTDYNVIFDRGFTGHEHLPQFGLINMNGRVYDPFLARFLSPDPFVQAPNYTQNFNRYSYAFNNPLKYTDPDMNWNNVDNFWQGLGYFGIGAGAGALAAGIGAGFGTLVAGSGSFGFMSASGLTAAGVIPGAAAGSTAGFTSGLVTGTGNSLMQGEKLKQSVGNGLKSGAWGFTIGGVTGGLFGGYQAHRLGNNILTGNPVGGRFGNIPELQQFGRLTSNLDPVELNMSNIRRSGMSMVDDLVTPELKPGIYGRVQGLGEVNGKHLVYQGYDKAGSVRYIGITERAPGIRFGEHFSSGTAKSLLRYEVVPGATNLSRSGARVWEQNLINQYGLQKDGGLLLKKLFKVCAIRLQ